MWVYFYPGFLRRKVLCNHVVHVHLPVCLSVSLPNFRTRYPISTKFESAAEDSKLLSSYKLHENKLLHRSWRFKLVFPWVKDHILSTRGLSDNWPVSVFIQISCKACYSTCWPDQIISVREREYRAIWHQSTNHPPSLEEKKRFCFLPFVLVLDSNTELLLLSLEICFMDCYCAIDEFAAVFCPFKTPLKKILLFAVSFLCTN